MKKKNLYLKQSKFNKKLFILCLALMLLTTSSMHLTYKAFKKTKNEIITYKERSGANYKIILKKDSHFRNMSLDRNNENLSKVVDKVRLNFNYTFNVNKEAQATFKHKILAKLIIRSEDSLRTFYEKNIDLTREITDDVKNINAYYISENVDIDYNHYNKLASKIKSNYKGNPISLLNVYLVVNSQNNNLFKGDSNKVLASIPLTDNNVNIAIKNHNVDASKQVISPSKIIIKNYKYLGLTILAVIITLFVFIKLFIEMKNNHLEKRKNLGL